MIFNYQTFLDTHIPDDDGLVQAYVADYGRKKLITSEPFYKRFLSGIEPIEFRKSQIIEEQFDGELLFRLLVGHKDLVDYCFEIDDENDVPEIVLFLDNDNPAPGWRNLSDLWAHEIYSLMCNSLISQMQLINCFGLGQNICMVEQEWDRLKQRYDYRKELLKRALEYRNRQNLQRQKVRDIIGYNLQSIEEPKLSVKLIRDLIDQERIRRTETP